MARLLSGRPATWIVPDSRTIELRDKFALPNVPIERALEWTSSKNAMRANQASKNSMSSFVPQVCPNCSNHKRIWPSTLLVRLIASVKVRLQFPTMYTRPRLSHVYIKQHKAKRKIVSSLDLRQSRVTFCGYLQYNSRQHACRHLTLTKDFLLGTKQPFLRSLPCSQILSKVDKGRKQKTA